MRKQSSSMEALYEIYYGLFQPSFIKTTPELESCHLPTFPQLVITE